MWHPPRPRHRCGSIRSTRRVASGLRTAIEPALAALSEAAARDDVNLMPALVDAARVHASEGEIVHALQRVFGAYTETPVF